MFKIFLFILFCSNLALAAENPILERFESNIDEYKGAEIFCHYPEESNQLDLFQHCYLRFVHKNNYYNDVAINFQVVTNTNNNLLEAIPLTFGAYPMTMLVQNFSVVWNTYFFKGEVKSFRSILNLADSELSNLKQSVIQFYNNPKLIGTYTLFNNNCVGGIINLFKHSNIISEITNDEFHPKRFSSWLIRSGLSTYPISQIKPNHTLKEAGKVLGKTIDELYQPSNWPEDSFKLLEENFFILLDPEGRRKMFQNLLLGRLNMPLSLRKLLSDKYKFLNNDDYQATTQLNSYTAESYQKFESGTHFEMVLNQIERKDTIHFLKAFVQNTEFESDKYASIRDYYQITKPFIFNFDNHKNPRVKLKRAFGSYYLGKCPKDDPSCHPSHSFRKEAIKLPIELVGNNAFLNGKSCDGKEIYKNKIGKSCYFLTRKDVNSIYIYSYINKEYK